ncbi:ABC exporter membrane fusion protein [Cylindrospermum sp. FACHB-282]|uniref:ABC exporter membrane fusion protein n=1 Tax=Cylindrospermum sp. FACHB-282 TaxID=2692794 RepID=UPI001F54B5A3|nr:ABC exporter membrane fusion protein [Cylindrospermum sp. FACHB-282]
MKRSSAKTIITVASFLSLSCLIIGVYKFFANTDNTQQASQLVQNTKPNKRNLIAALGRVEPQGEVIIVGGPIGERVGKMLVHEGQEVKQNSILTYLESYPERFAEKEVAASQVNEARIRLKTETKLGKAGIEEARSRLEQVKLPQYLEIGAQQANVKRLELELKTAKTTLARFQNLKNEGAISQQTLDERLLSFNSKQEEVNSAKATLSRLIQERQANLLNVQTQIQSAQANLERSQSQVLLKSSLQQFNLAQARLERTITRAPKSGQILKIIARGGESITQDGILQIGDTQQMYIVAEVYETDIAELRVGQRAHITSSIFPQKLQGIVDKIGLQIGKKDILATDPAAQVDSRVVEVKIRLDQEDSKLVAGLTNLRVTVKIDI